jgi:hypothetical protein
MVTLAKDFEVNDTFNDGFGLEARSSFLGESSGELVHCVLHISRATLPIDIPARLLAEHRRSASSEILLAVSAEETSSVRRSPAPSALQQREADGWMTEMHDFDRF